MKITDDEIVKIEEYMRLCADKLMELGCDSVQVITTAMSGSNCMRRDFGAGNIFTRHGSVRSWIDDQRDMSTANEIASALSEEDL